MSDQNKSPSQPEQSPEHRLNESPSVVPPSEPAPASQSESPQPTEPPKEGMQPDPASKDTVFLDSEGQPVVKPPVAGIKCTKCGHLNRPGELVCENCGQMLVKEGEVVTGTKRFDKEGEEADSKASASTDTGEMLKLAMSTAGSNQFHDNMVLRLEIEGAPTPILLHPKSETSIGRRDPATGTMPDVDLTAYAGYRLGVSRKHAVIRLKNKQLEIYDLGSSNGTSINGVRLVAHQPQQLRDGDEIMLGKMAIKVLFQVRNRRK